MCQRLVRKGGNVAGKAKCGRDEGGGSRVRSGCSPPPLSLCSFSPISESNAGHKRSRSAHLITSTHSGGVFTSPRVSSSGSSHPGPEQHLGRSPLHPAHLALHPAREEREKETERGASAGSRPLVMEVPHRLHSFLPSVKFFHPPFVTNSAG